MTRSRNREIIILRGLPGTGKSNLARQIKEGYGSGQIFSTDDFFKKNGVLEVIPKRLHIAHMWNRERVFEAIKGKEHPIIIDNTNLTKWDMWPYVRMAFRRGYWISFKELPEKNINDLYRICGQKIPKEALFRMRRKYQHVKNIWEVLHDRDSKWNWMSSSEWQNNRW